MNRHELDYGRFLIEEIKRLQAESQAKSVLLDSWTMQSNERNRNDWRPAVQNMVADPVFRSSVEATIAPYLTRLHRGLVEAPVLVKPVED